MEPSATYGVREVAQLLGVPPARVRSLARAGLVEVQRGARGELRFGFRELAFLRQLRDLRGDRKSARRAHRALARLRAALPADRDLCALGLATAAGELVVRETGRLWSPESGRLADAEAHYRAALAARAGDVTARFDLAVALEDQRRLDEARAAYLACVADDPACAEAHYNLARLSERAGDLAAALRHLIAYRRIVATD